MTHNERVEFYMTKIFPDLHISRETAEAMIASFDEARQSQKLFCQESIAEKEEEKAEKKRVEKAAANKTKRK